MSTWMIFRTILKLTILFRASDAVNVRRTDRQRSLLYILEDA